ncbi:hypothetical protein [Paenibacillus sp. GXUN7292]|uniref:hypothetical protein n=1 Tax=Paenibacillus sp. GXUN7292 TaxID=3422499 RepID=UPI003D7E9E34
MQIYFRVKAAGKRRPVLELVEASISEYASSLREVIQEIVTEQVRRYNDRSIEQAIFPYLTHEQLENQAQSGKVGFGAAYDERQADEELAVAHAWQAFEDGIYKVLVDEKVIERLDQPLELKEGAVFTFIRLTLLSGTMY